jgi:hypothetical protein
MASGGGGSKAPASRRPAACNVEGWGQQPVFFEAAGFLPRHPLTFLDKNVPLQNCEWGGPTQDVAVFDRNPNGTCSGGGFSLQRLASGKHALLSFKG